MGRSLKTHAKVQRLGWRLAICAALLVWVFHNIFVNEGRSAWGAGSPAWEQLSRLDQWRAAWRLGPPALWQNLAVVQLWALLVSVLIMGVTIFLGAFRWLIALRVQGLRLPWGRALRISLVAHFFNSFLLGSTGGDLIKAYYAARETAHRKTEAIVTVFVDRVVGLWTMLLFAIIMVVPNLELLRTHDRLRLLLFAIAGMFVAGSGFVGLAFWGGLSRGWRSARERLRRLPKGEWLERSLESCREFGRHRRFFLRMVMVSMALNVVCVSQYLVLASGMGFTVPVEVWFLAVPAIICISALPITPNGLGVRENLYVAILAAAPFLIPHAAALAISLLAYAGSLLWSIVGGIVYLFFKQREHLEEVTVGEPADS